MSLRSLIVALPLAGLLAATPAAAAPLSVGSGTTVVTFSLKRAGATVSPVSPARKSGTGISFRIAKGTIDTASGVGTLGHSGSAVLRRGSRRVTLSSVKIKAGKPATLTAVVGGTRRTLATLRVATTTITVTGASLVVGRATLVTTSVGARALNRALRTTRGFRKGRTLGTAKITANPSLAVTLRGGTTTLRPDPNTAAQLVGAGVFPSPIAPATANQDGSLNFPIKVGSIVEAQLKTGTLGHTGGLRLSRGSTVLDVTEFDVRFDATPSVFARIAGGGFSEMADVDLSGKVGPTVSGATVTVSGVILRLTAQGAAGINAVFGTALQPGAPLGVTSTTGQL